MRLGADPNGTSSGASYVVFGQAFNATLNLQVPEPASMAMVATVWRLDIFQGGAGGI
ncbi:hypothetical protein [Nitrosomonas sp.]|uniref:hypothetical protein n=1 Tax=Nitrosomonas sp. TaxID=42353 RepID=UPI00263A01B5|nr:hypothetical protein [Nitrosomonas sp.]